MTNVTTPVLMADLPPTPWAAERRKKARCSKNLHNRRKNAVSELNFAPFRVSRDVISVPASNFAFAGSEVRHVAA